MADSFQRVDRVSRRLNVFALLHDTSSNSLCSREPDGLRAQCPISRCDARRNRWHVAVGRSDGGDRHGQLAIRASSIRRAAACPGRGPRRLWAAGRAALFLYRKPCKRETWRRRLRCHHARVSRQANTRTSCGSRSPTERGAGRAIRPRRWVRRRSRSGCTPRLAEPHPSTQIPCCSAPEPLGPAAA